MTMTRSIKAGSTDQSVVIRIVDATDGTPETAVEFNTAGIDLWYRREGAAKVSITEVALAALTTAHADGGIEHIGDGYYRLDLPDAALATAETGVMVGGTITGMVVWGTYVELAEHDATTLIAAVQSGLATLALQTTIASYLDTEVAAIKAKTDNLPSDPADASIVAGLIATAQADLDNIQTRLPAALVSGRLDAHVGAVAGETVTGSGTVADPWRPV